jgi:hypothetical protein
MACSLTVLGPNDIADFKGTSGQPVTLQLKAQDSNVVADIVHADYAGDTVSGPPFTFTLKSGESVLQILVDASEEDAALQLQEDCGNGSANPLNTFRFKEGNPLKRFLVQAV